LKQGVSVDAGSLEGLDKTLIWGALVRGRMSYLWQWKLSNLYGAWSYVWLQRDEHEQVDISACFERL